MPILEPIAHPSPTGGRCRHSRVNALGARASTDANSSTIAGRGGSPAVAAIVTRMSDTGVEAPLFVPAVDRVTVLSMLASDRVPLLTFM
jgi:hypothetical protein